MHQGSALKRRPLHRVSHGTTHGPQLLQPPIEKSLRVSEIRALICRLEHLSRGIDGTETRALRIPARIHTDITRKEPDLIAQLRQLFERRGDVLRETHETQSLLPVRNDIGIRIRAQTSERQGADFAAHAEIGRELDAVLEGETLGDEVVEHDGKRAVGEQRRGGNVGVAGGADPEGEGVVREAVDGNKAQSRGENLGFGFAEWRRRRVLVGVVERPPRREEERAESRRSAEETAERHSAPHDESVICSTNTHDDTIRGEVTESGSRMMTLQYHWLHSHGHQRLRNFLFCFLHNSAALPTMSRSTSMFDISNTQPAIPGIAKSDILV